MLWTKSLNVMKSNSWILCFSSFLQRFLLFSCVVWEKFCTCRKVFKTCRCILKKTLIMIQQILFFLSYFFFLLILSYTTFYDSVEFRDIGIKRRIYFETLKSHQICFIFFLSSLHLEKMRIFYCQYNIIVMFCVLNFEVNKAHNASISNGNYL